MPFPRSFLFWAALLPLPLCAAQDPCDFRLKDPIDAAQERDIEQDSSTFGMRAASNAAREKWDKEMNAIYKRLMAKLEPDRAAALQKSQRAWLAFRDAENNAITTIVATQEGTMYQLNATSMGTELVKARTLDLRGYECMLKEL